MTNHQTDKDSTAACAAAPITAREANGLPTIAHAQKPT